MSIFVGPENIQYRIRKNQSRARNVGITYWIATIVLFVFSVFPYVGGMSGFAEDGHLWIVSFLPPILELASGKMTGAVLVNAVAAILYACMFIFTFGNFIIATTRLFRITKKNPTNKLGYNRASRGTKTMGKAYARMFFWMLTSTVVSLLISDGEFTLFFYIAFVLALFFHFLCNFSACKISYFQATEDRFRPIEKIRTENRTVCMLRNAWQFVSIVLIAVFMDKFGLRLGALFDLADASKSASIFANNLLDGVVLPVILLLVLVCLVVCVRHATGTTEYNENGTKGRGMKTCRIFATMIAVLAIVGEVVVLIVPSGTNVPKWAFLAIFTVAVQWVVAENMFLELSKKKEELEAEELKSLEETEKEKTEKVAKIDEKAQKKAAKAQKKEAKAKKKSKKQLEKERLAEILSDIDNAPGDPFGEFEEEENRLKESFATGVDESAVSENNVSLLDEFAPNSEPFIQETVVQPTIVRQESDFTAVEDAPFETFVQQAHIGKSKRKLAFPQKDQIERLALKKKWMAMAEHRVEDEKPINLKGKELVNCPHCKQKLSVKITATAVQCPTCKTKFRLKRAEASVAEHYPIDERGNVNLQAGIERMRNLQVELDAKYLAEAEEELRKLMESEEA